MARIYVYGQGTVAPMIIGGVTNTLTGLGHEFNEIPNLEAPSGSYPADLHIHVSSTIDNSVRLFLLSGIRTSDRVRTARKADYLDFEAQLVDLLDELLPIPRSRPALTADQVFGARFELFYEKAWKAVTTENSRLRRELEQARIDIEDLKKLLEVARNAKASGHPVWTRRVLQAIGAIGLAAVSGTAGGIGWSTGEHIFYDKPSAEVAVVDIAKTCDALVTLLETTEDYRAEVRGLQEQVQREQVVARPDTIRAVVDVPSATASSVEPPSP